MICGKYDDGTQGALKRRAALVWLTPKSSLWVMESRAGSDRNMIPPDWQYFKSPCSLGGRHVLQQLVKDFSQNVHNAL